MADKIVKHYSRSFSWRERLLILFGAEVYISVRLDKPQFNRWALNPNFYALQQTVLDLTS